MTSTSVPASSTAPADLSSTRPYEPARDLASPNRNLAPLSTAIDAEGRLEVGGCTLSELARRYGT
ncbi:MAG: diaminopimelate decarboxylase, partial [Vulcanococcus sp.]